MTNGYLTASGWERVEELKRAHVASRYAFFARKFANNDLDAVYENCLVQAVSDTGYELRTVTQKAGHIDAIIEDEIRRCRFLVADLTDANAGAYWEAGLAEGLGKPVIYICRDRVQTHFDTDHRHTVRWDSAKLDETAKRLKAVIRNTLFSDADEDDKGRSALCRPKKFRPTMVARRPSGFIEPCLPSKVARPPSGPLWVHEIKHDGYRLMVRRDGARVRCFTRNGHDWADRFPAIVDAAAASRRRRS